jgi:hypothetical protein
LKDIELHNTRMARDIEFRIRERIERYGQDGKKILGIDIPVPVPFKREEKRKEKEENFSENMLDKKDPPLQMRYQEERKNTNQSPILVKHSDVVMNAAQKPNPLELIPVISETK